MAGEWVPFCFHKDLKKAKEKRNFTFIPCHLRLAISHVCLIPGESPDELQAQQYSLHVFRGFYCKSGRGQQTIKSYTLYPWLPLKNTLGVCVQD